MTQLIIRLVINTVAIWVAAYVTNAVLPARWGSIVGLDDVLSLLLVALVLGLVNALIRPLVLLITCLLQVLTLGLFTLVVNALMLKLAVTIAEALGSRLHIEGFGPAFFAAILITVVSTVLTRFVR